MKPFCKPGDMAVVIGAPDEFNTGLVVEVLRTAVADPCGTCWDWPGDTWWVRCSVPLTWVHVEAGSEVSEKEGPLPESVLYPIRGTRVGCEREEVPFVFA